MNINDNYRPIQRALISSWRKEPAIELAIRLNKLGIGLVASGGTTDALAKAGIPVEPLSDKTGFDNLLGGRVKTLHPVVYAPILARRNVEADIQDLENLNLESIDLVIVDLYPFPAREEEVNTQSALDLIDIGGVSLIRAAAKNFPDVAVLCRAEQFDGFAEHLEKNDGVLDYDYRRELAIQAFQWTTIYDQRIAARLTDGTDESEEQLIIPLRRSRSLRYGENPHQSAAFYVSIAEKPSGIQNMRQLGGKKLSYINLLDIDIALRLPREFDQPAVSILKHTTPCGVGIGDSPCEAFKNAHSTDPQSAFGSIIGFNRTVDLETARAIRKGFVEVVTAPAFDEDAVKELKRSKNLRIIEMPDDPVRPDDPPLNEQDIRSVFGGFLIQQQDTGFPELDDIQIATKREPTSDEMEALRFAWIAVRYVKSNAILMADNKHTIGIGAGQMSRVDAAHLAIWKARQAGLDISGSVAASDAFFPFRDGLDVLVDAGVTAIIQPGGSIRDSEVIEAADERDVAMILTGRRHFRH
ncbi:MAG: bifunctional phosphoribosylaminoimidazolecarboxamide formyltransferase/IMP cyclohydrolase [Candidatus Electryoneaceae bacterium]|nr:bifunctional phosphoribosylaminoimidazolecarboxamide formyltransferase/IMP cyclohydrolase [Candidatus Electryoneaceae bacterium]